MSQLVWTAASQVAKAGSIPAWVTTVTVPLPGLGTQRYER